MAFRNYCPTGAHRHIQIAPQHLYPLSLIARRVPEVYSLADGKITPPKHQYRHHCQAYLFP
ncbi:MAG: hypothetical protein QGI79_02445, partial [Dehalococcoidia bacterium]|nr:hypothetical protein [Dehalococcoidia bacterium]